ncbi:hypothetical protein C1H76_2886 [Elsinoe australis]|uniref:Increased recombination centers protein 6 n=1 Tax=Elsinoe australis TaxID=40998 RepID=A0A4U7B1F9_9PEZI|nr:hypothetical protein C1H76_2886 [Elsinoe australis]
MKIQQPRRLLVVGKPECDMSGLIAKLTGQKPNKDISGSVAGSIHEWQLKTNYYSADIPIWIDELADLGQWKAEFSKSEAKEVIEALGGWIYCFNKPSATPTEPGLGLNHEVQATIAAIESVIETACGYGWDGMKLAVAMSAPGVKSSSLDYDEWEELCLDQGFEYIDADATGKNDFGEAVGLERLKDAVKTNDWEPQISSALDDDGEAGDFGEGNFGMEEAEMNAELWGLKASLLTGTEEDDERPENQKVDVDSLETLMRQAMSIKEASMDLPLEERKRFTLREIEKLAKDV